MRTPRPGGPLDRALKNAQKKGPSANAKCAPPIESAGRASAPADPFDVGMTLAELVRADLPAVSFVLGGVLPEGLSILAGRPKGGKSWLAMMVAICVAVGTLCLGARSVAPRPVLHLALEDTRRRYRDRALMQLPAIGATAPATLEVRTSWPRAGKGGLLRLAEWFKDHPGGLVIVDTLAKFRDPPSGRGSSYDEDYHAVSELKALADQNDGAVLVIHHTRKGAAEDPFDEVSGTLGINGAADSLMVLDRQRGADSAALYLTGRDLADATLSLTWDGCKGLWSLVSRADGIERPERVATPGKVDRCAAWLKTFLTAFAFPDSEILTAAQRSAFTPEDVKRAKAALRKETPALRSKARGFGGTWWNWIGTDVPDRTEAAKRELLGDTTETTDTGEQGA